MLWCLSSSLRLPQNLMQVMSCHVMSWTDRLWARAAFHLENCTDDFMAVTGRSAVTDLRDEKFRSQFNMETMLFCFKFLYTRTTVPHTIFIIMHTSFKRTVGITLRVTQEDHGCATNQARDI